jgi:AcrR family transcriptional regulator
VASAEEIGMDDPAMTDQPDRRAAILDAAAAVFFRDGYARARIDDIIAITGGSKRNIYQGFGGKEGLFEALISDRTALVVQAIEEARTDPGALEDRLVQFGDQATQILFSQAMLGILRAIMSAGPDVANDAAGRISTTLTLITTQMARILAESEGTLPPDSQHGLLADQLLSLLRGGLHIELLIGNRAAISDDQRRVHVRAAVNTFLNGYSAGRPTHIGI